MTNQKDNRIHDKNNLGFVSVTADVFFDFDQKDQTEVHLQGKAFCNPVSWETELIWQVAKMIIENHKDKGIAVEALEHVLNRVKETNSPDKSF